MSDEAETPILDLIATMTEASVGLEPRPTEPDGGAHRRSDRRRRTARFLRVEPRGGRQCGLDGDTVRSVFAAVAPIVGTARVASAAVNVGRALGFAELVAELELERTRRGRGRVTRAGRSGHRPATEKEEDVQERRSGAVGWTAFAGIMLILIGFFHALAGSRASSRTSSYASPPTTCSSSMRPRGGGST